MRVVEYRYIPRLKRCYWGIADYKSNRFYFGWHTKKDAEHIFIKMKFKYIYLIDLCFMKMGQTKKKKETKVDHKYLVHTPRTVRKFKQIG